MLLLRYTGNDRFSGNDRYSGLQGPDRFSAINVVYCITALRISRFVTCNGAEENQAHRCDHYDLRVQEQPLFLVCSRIVFLLLWIKSHRSKNSDSGAEQK